MLSICARLEPFVALALIRSLRVDAMAVLAQIGVGSAFVDVTAIVRHADLSVAFRADAHEGSDQVLASELAVVGRSSTFVDI